MTPGFPDLCSNCDAELQDERPGEERMPCPNCGSIARTKRGVVSVIGHATVEATGKVIYSWDGASLTLFGVLYGILATVFGVIVAPYGWPQTGLYAVVTLALLVLCLLFLAQRIIGWMRWLLERGR